MAIVFYVLGSIIMVLGGLVMLAPLAALRYAPSDMYGYPGMAGLGLAAALLPGLGFVFFGLLILAIGGVLGRLDKIAQHTREAWQLQYNAYAEASQRQRL